MATIHISEAAAAADFASLLSQVENGVEIVIERDAKPVAVLAPARLQRGRTVTEIATALKTLEAGRGEPLRMGADFADDLDEIIRNRQPSAYENTWD